MIEEKITQSRQRQEQELKCDQHGKQLIVYCKQCNTLACAGCLVTHKDHTEDIVDIDTANKEYNEILQNRLRSAKINGKQFAKQLSELKQVKEQVEEHKMTLENKINKDILDTKQTLKSAYEESVKAVDDLGRNWSSSLGSEVVRACQQLEQHVQDETEKILKYKNMFSNSSIVAKANLIRTVSPDNSLPLPPISEESATDIMQQLTNAADAASWKIINISKKIKFDVARLTTLDRLNIAANEQQSELSYRIVCVSQTNIVFVVNNEIHCFDKATRQTRSCFFSQDKIIDAVITRNNDVMVYTTPRCVVSSSLTGKIYHRTSIERSSGLFMDSNESILLAANNKIYISHNNGCSWDVVCESPDKAVRLLQALKVKGNPQSLVDTYWVVEQHACGACTPLEYTVHKVNNINKRVSRKRINTNVASHFTASSRISYNGNDCVIVTCLECNIIDAYRVSDCRFLGRINTASTDKDANLTIVSKTFGQLAAYTFNLDTNKQPCDVCEFKFSSLQNVFCANPFTSEINRTFSFRSEQNGFVFYCMSVCTSGKLIAFAYLKNVWIVKESEIISSFSTSEDGHVIDLLILPQSIVYVSQNGSIYVVNHQGRILSRIVRIRACCLCKTKRGIAMLTTDHTLRASTDGGQSWQEKKRKLGDRSFHRIVQVQNSQTQSDSEVFWIIEQVSDVYCLTELALDDICSDNADGFMSRIVTGAPNGIISNRSRLAFDGEDHVFVSDGLANGSVHAFCVSSRSYVGRVLKPEADRGLHKLMGIAYDVEARQLYVGLAQHESKNCIGVYTINFPAANVQPPILMPVGDTDKISQSD